MVFANFAELGGNEVVNDARCRGYWTSSPWPHTWMVATQWMPNMQPALQALGDPLSQVPYSYANISAAPWYDASDPDVSSRFFGVMGIGITGLPDSSRAVAVVESIYDGGTLSSPRKAVRQATVTAWLFAKGRDALEYGFSWLDSVLDADACGQHGQLCGLADFTYLADAPSVGPSQQDYSKWAENPTPDWTNLAANPSFKTASTAQTVRTNLSTNPASRTTALSGSSTNTATIAQVTGLTGHPLGLTTGTQLTWAAADASAGTVGVLLGYTPAADTGYMISLWYRFTTAPTNGYLQIGVGGSPLSPSDSTYSTTWKKMTVYTGTTLGSSGTVLRFTGGTTAGVLQVTGILIEKTTTQVAQPYFDGVTTPATRVNLAPSPSFESTSAGVGLFFTPTLSFNTTDPRPGSFGTTSLVVTCNAQYDGIRSGSHPINVGDTLHAVFWTKAAAGVTLLASFNGSSSFGGLGQVTITGTGTWQRTEMTYTVVSGDSAQHLAQLQIVIDDSSLNFDSGATTPFQVDDWLFEINTTGDYFDATHPPILRQNLHSDPAATAIGASSGAGDVGEWLWRNNDTFGVGGAGAYSSGTDATDSPYGLSTYIRKTWTAAPSALGTDAYGNGFAWHQSQATSGGIVAPGQTYTISALLRPTWDGANGYVLLTWIASDGTTATIVQGTEVPLTAAEWTQVSFTATAPTNAEYLRVFIRLTNDSALPGVGDTLDGSGALMEMASTVGSFFDGSTTPADRTYAWKGAANASQSYAVKAGYATKQPTGTANQQNSILYDTDFSTAWSGTADASASNLQGTAASGANAYGTILVQSSHWSSDGDQKSGRVIVNSYSNNDNWAFFCGTTSTAANLPAPFVAGGTYTVYATVHLEAALSGTLLSSGIGLLTRWYTNAWSSVLGALTAAENAPGTYFTSYTFTLPPGTVGIQIGLHNPSYQFDGDVWVDQLLVVEGEYDGDYFDGDTPSDPDYDDGSGTIYAWTGATDASTSTSSSLQQVPDVDAFTAAENAWVADMTDLVRFLHGVGVISGPKVDAEYESMGIHAYQVEWTVAATNPHIYRQTQDLALPPSLPVVVGDVPYNLAPYPSMELGQDAEVLTQFTVGANFVENPSLETSSTTGWTATAAAVSGSVPSSYLTSAVSTDLAADGTHSFLARLLGNGSTAASGVANVTVGVAAATGAPAAGTRLSCSIWAAAEVAAGASGSTLSKLSAQLVWLNSSGAAIGSPVAVGQAVTDSSKMAGVIFSVSSLVPPSGTASATLEVILECSWASSATAADNSDIRLYVDAAAVTLP